MDKELVNSWDKILELAEKKEQLHDTVVTSIKNMEMVLINLKIEAAHIEVETGKGNAIGIICNNLEKTINDLEDESKMISKTYHEYEGLKKYINKKLKGE